MNSVFRYMLASAVCQSCACMMLGGCGMQPRQCDEHRASEQRVAPRVVRVVARCVAVEARAGRNTPRSRRTYTRGVPGARAVDRLVDARRLRARTDRHGERRPDGLELGALAHRAIQRHEHRDRNAGGRLILREAGDRLAKSAGARERRELGCQVHHRRRASRRGASSGAVDVSLGRRRSACSTRPAGWAGARRGDFRAVDGRLWRHRRAIAGDCSALHSTPVTCLSDVTSIRD